MEKTLKRTFRHATMIFGTCYLLVLAYLFSFYGLHLSPGFFWIPITVAIGMVAWQSTRVGSDKTRIMCVLFEVLALGFLAHLIFVIPVNAGVIGRDVFADLKATQFDLQYGWPLPPSVPATGITRTVSDWPLIHFLGVATSQLLGLELFSVSNPNSVMRWVPTVVSQGAPLFWFAIARRSYGRADVGLLASLASSMVFYNIMFHAWYVRETLGYVLLFAFLLAFVIASARGPQSTKMRFVAIVILVGLLFSHHLSFLFAILFLALAVFVPRLLRRVLSGHSARRDAGIHQEQVSAEIMLLLSGTMFVAYLIYVGQPIFGLAVDSIRAVFEPSVEVAVRSSGALVSRDRVLLAARVVFGLIFSLILIRQILRKTKTLWWDAIGFAWGAVTGLAVVVSYLVANVVNAGILRLEGFGWPFVLAPASQVTVERKPPARGVFLLVAFIILNLLIIPPYIYDSGAKPDYEIGETSIRYDRTLYEAAGWFSGNGTIVGDVSTFELFGDFGQNSVVTDFQVFGGNLTRVANYDWIVLRQENSNVVVSLSGSKVIGKLTPTTRNLMSSTNALDRVYDNGDIEIFFVTHH